jgi:hypothetical protein
MTSDEINKYYTSGVSTEYEPVKISGEIADTTKP